jgi:hypothetical protein
MKLEELTELMKDVLENRGFTEQDIERFENITELRKFLQNLNAKKWQKKNPDYQKNYKQENKEKNRSYVKKWNSENPEYIKKYQIEKREKIRLYAKRCYYKKRGREDEMPSL